MLLQVKSLNAISQSPQHSFSFLFIPKRNYYSILLWIYLYFTKYFSFSYLQVLFSLRIIILLKRLHNLIKSAFQNVLFMPKELVQKASLRPLMISHTSLSLISSMPHGFKLLSLFVFKLLFMREQSWNLKRPKRFGCEVLHKRGKWNLCTIFHLLFKEWTLPKVFLYLYE